MKSAGVSDTNMAYATGFVRNTESLIKQLDLSTDTTVRDFLSQFANHDHSVGTSLITALLLGSLNFGSDKSIQIVGISALLHGIGLSKTNPGMEDEDEAKMTSEQKARFYTHPAVSVQILSKFSKIEPSVIQAVGPRHKAKSKKASPIVWAPGKSIALPIVDGSRFRQISSQSQAGPSDQTL